MGSGLYMQKMWGEGEEREKERVEEREIFLMNGIEKKEEEE